MPPNASRNAKVALKRRKKLDEFFDSLGEYSAVFGVPKASRWWRVSKGCARYRRDKFLDQNKAYASHGGARTGFSEEKAYAILSALKDIVKNSPMLSVGMMKDRIFDITKYRVGHTYIKDALALADWSYV